MDNNQKRRSKFVFYAQSTITVISGRYTFCHYTIDIKNMYVLRLICIYRFFKTDLKIGSGCQLTHTAQKRPKLCYLNMYINSAMTKPKCSPSPPSSSLQHCGHFKPSLSPLPPPSPPPMPFRHLSAHSGVSCTEAETSCLPLITSADCTSSVTALATFLDTKARFWRPSGVGRSTTWWQGYRGRIQNGVKGNQRKGKRNQGK